MERRGFFSRLAGAAAGLFGAPVVAIAALSSDSDGQRLLIPESLRMIRPCELFFWSADHSANHSNDAAIDVLAFLEWKATHPGSQYVAESQRLYKSAS